MCIDVSARLPAMTRARPSETDFDAFFRRERVGLVALAAAVSGSHLAAEDLAHEALTRAYQRWDRLVEYDKPGAWVRRVTINLALSSRKRLANEAKARLRLRAEPTMAPAPEIHDDVWAAVKQLPGKQRAAVALHYLEDRSTAEIAEVLDCAEATARVHLHRGRQALGEMLEEGR